MRKYFQITFFLGIFGLLVFIRQARGNSESPIVVGRPTSSPTNTPTPAATVTPQVSSTPQPSVTPVSTPVPTPKGQYKNGTYTGSVEDAFYGNIQVQAVISGGKISDVIFLQYPNDNRTSQFINSQAMPILKQEAIQAQSASVDIVSGASSTSPAFQASLANALAQAKN